MKEIVDKINRLCDKQKTDKRELWEFLKNDGPELETIIKIFAGRIVRVELADGSLPIDKPEGREVYRDIAKNKANREKVDREAREISERKNRAGRNHV